MMRAGERLGGFEIIETLGRGGMGVVYLARPARGFLEGLLDKKKDGTTLVALKTLGDASGVKEDALKRFSNEHEILSLLDHPNIVRSFGPMLHDQGAHFFCMEFVSGKSLAQTISEAGRLAPPRAAAIARQILRALGAAHGKNVVHRDVKPNNILLGRDGAVKVADFGLAHVIEWTRLTVGSGVVGTPSYMAPEQLESRTVDPRTDLYAVAAVLFEMLTGRPPFVADNPHALLVKHLKETAPRLKDTGASLGIAGLEPFDDLVARGLSKNPEDRFPDSAAFIAALEKACPEIDGAAFVQKTAEAFATTVILSRPKRSKWLVAVGALVVLAGAAGALALRAPRAQPTPVPTPAPAPEAPSPPAEPARIAVIRVRGRAEPVRGKVIERQNDAWLIEQTNGERVVLPDSAVEGISYETR
jgi:serine/threonine-protein kinase